MNDHILIVDDELDIQSSLSFALKDEGYDVVTASSPHEAEELLKTQSFDVGLYDVWFPQGDGIELLKWTREQFPQTNVIMMSGHGNIELALKAIRMGAYDFLEKPLELEKLLVVLRNTAETIKLRKENRRLLKEKESEFQMIGRSDVVRHLISQIDKASQVHSHVLILGENGTGKEVVARQLHFKSSRKDKPFIAVNCAAMPEGLIESELFGHEKGAFTGASSRAVGRFEQADEGTLFLDEIGELSLNAQGKLLRVLESRSFERVGGRQILRTSARVLVATNRDLAADVKEGRFREDLFFRLNVLSITVPPLRERAEDLTDLLEYLGHLVARELRKPNPQFKEDLLAWMKKYEWPGNVRELRNLIERMMIMSGTYDSVLSLADLPEELQSYSETVSLLSPLQIQDMGGTLREIRSAVEKSIIQQRIEKMGGNVTRTAESLGVERTHLHRKLKQYAILQTTRGES